MPEGPVGSRCNDVSAAEQFAFMGKLSQRPSMQLQVWLRLRRFARDTCL